VVDFTLLGLARRLTRLAVAQADGADFGLPPEDVGLGRGDLAEGGDRVGAGERVTIESIRGVPARLLRAS